MLFWRLRISQHNVLTRAQTTNFEMPSLVGYGLLDVSAAEEKPCPGEEFLSGKTLSTKMGRAQLGENSFDG